jgi:hypothetical protein
MNILQQTLKEMNHSFSSNEFSKKAQKNGLSKQEINSGAISYFLHSNAVQGNTRRRWRKHDGLTSDKNTSDKIMDAIYFLKSHGYKVFKPVSDWIEI